MSDNRTAIGEAFRIARADNATLRDALKKTPMTDKLDELYTAWKEAVRAFHAAATYTQELAGAPANIFTAAYNLRNELARVERGARRVYFDLLIWEQADE